MEKLILMSIKDFAAETASDSPAPGGGSVSAVAGALAASLANMVYNLSKGKKKYEALEPETRKKIEAEFEELSALKEKMLLLTDEDTEAFNLFMKALKMPKASEEEKALRKKAMASAAEASLKVPLETAEASLEILQKLAGITEHGNINAISDCGVAAELARAAFKGAILNVKINLPSVENEELVAKTQEKIKTLESEEEVLYKELSAMVEARM